MHTHLRRFFQLPLFLFAAASAIDNAKAGAPCVDVATCHAEQDQTALLQSKVWVEDTVTDQKEETTKGAGDSASDRHMIASEDEHATDFELEDAQLSDANADETGEGVDDGSEAEGDDISGVESEADVLEEGESFEQDDEEGDDIPSFETEEQLSEEGESFDTGEEEEPQADDDSSKEGSFEQDEDEEPQGDDDDAEDQEGGWDEDQDMKEGELTKAELLEMEETASQLENVSSAVIGRGGKGWRRRLRRRFRRAARRARKVRRRVRKAVRRGVRRARKAVRRGVRRAGRRIHKRFRRAGRRFHRALKSRFGGRRRRNARTLNSNDRWYFYMALHASKYNTGRIPPGWSQRLRKEVGSDSLTVYRNSRSKTCALGFQCLGLSDVGDLKNMFLRNWFGRKYKDLNKCGVTNIDKGFFLELKTFTRQRWWNRELIPLLSGSECTGGLIVVGYSLGGSLADMFSGCTNNARGNHITMSGVGRVNFPTREVKAVYTYAGVPVSSRQTRNRKRRDGIFPGHRFYVQTRLSVDPTTDTRCSVTRFPLFAMAPWCGNKHIKQDAVRIYNPHPIYSRISRARRRRARQIFTPADRFASATVPAKHGWVGPAGLILHTDAVIRKLFDSVYAPRR